MLPGITLRLSSNNGLLNVMPEVTLPPVSRLLQGQPLDKALNTLALVYRQCGEAHRRAALTLLESQAQLIESDNTRLARDQALALEWVTEHSWQIWQLTHQLFGPDRDRMALLTEWRQTLNDIKTSLDPKRHQLGVESNAIAMPALHGWQERWQTQIWQPLLDAVQAKGWSNQFASPIELVRHQESGPAARQLARQLASQLAHHGQSGQDSISLHQRLHFLWQELWQIQATWQQPQGLLLAPGVVKAARGTLMHQGRLEDGHLVDYQILIPTEGTLVSIVTALENRAVAPPGAERENWQQGLEIWLGAHCPCVGIQLDWTSPNEVNPMEGAPVHA